MQLSILPDLERRQALASVNEQEPSYVVIEFRGYYARISFVAGLGELYEIKSINPDQENKFTAGIVVAASKEENVSLLLLERPLDVLDQPFKATRLDTEYLKVDVIKG